MKGDQCVKPVDGGDYKDANLGIWWLVGRVGCSAAEVFPMHS